MGVKKKTERREAKREAKAEKAAMVEMNIEKELLSRLHQGVYGDLYNLNTKEFNAMLDQDEQNEETQKALVTMKFKLSTTTYLLLHQRSFILR